MWTMSEKYPYPQSWGGGIYKLVAPAKPFFAALFAAMQKLGHDPRSNYPHASYNVSAYGPGPRALDIVDNAWKANAWMQPVEPYVTFYRDLGRVADALGLTWGGHWHGFAGSDSAWYKAWCAAGLSMGDMVHVEYRKAQGAVVPELDIEALKAP
jgi:hypothetical protein